MFILSAVNVSLFLPFIWVQFGVTCKCNATELDENHQVPPSPKRLHEFMDIKCMFLMAK